MRLLLITLLTTSPVLAQTISVSGGASSMFNASGGSVAIYTAGTNETFRIGVSNGRLVAGASSEFLFHGFDTTVGDKQLFLSTQQVGLSTVLRGLEAKKKDFTFFVGAVGQSYSTPYFSGVAAKDFGTGFQYTKKFEPATGKKKSGCRGVGCYTNHGTFELSTVVAYTGNKPTALQGVVYHWRGLQLQGTAGLLEKRTYFTGQSTLRFQHFSFDVGRQTFIWQGKRST